MREFRLHAKNEQPLVQPDIPLYNPSIHKSGDTVRMYQGNRLVVMTIPFKDADGSPIPEY